MKAAGENDPMRVIRSPLLSGSAIGICVTLALIDLFDLVNNWATLHAQLGVDYALYMNSAIGWIHGGSYFQSYQLAGPYGISAGDILYPPIALLLFVPFTFLPAILWWLIPGMAVVWCVVSLQPRRTAWPWLVACAAWPTTPLKVLTGNPVMWAVAALAVGVVYAWPSVLVLIKPSLFPFALFGARTRGWWIALGILLGVSLPFGSLWIDWIHSVLNSQGGGVAYSSLEIPMLAFPLVAWLGRASRTPRTGSVERQQPP